MCLQRLFTSFALINMLTIALFLSTQICIADAGEGDKDHGAGFVLFQHKISSLGIHRNEYLLLLSSRNSKPTWSFPKGHAKLFEDNLFDVFAAFLSSFFINFLNFTALLDCKAWAPRRNWNYGGISNYCAWKYALCK